jgi:hypothetical protein
VTNHFEILTWDVQRASDKAEGVFRDFRQKHISLDVEENKDITIIDSPDGSQIAAHDISRAFWDK